MIGAAAVAASCAQCGMRDAATFRSVIKVKSHTDADHTRCGLMIRASER
ncbi:hypothetical protein [Azospirillum melinis]